MSGNKKMLPDQTMDVLMLKKTWNWFFSIQERERPVKNAAEKLRISQVGRAGRAF
jgi:hypothetical protein